MSSGHYPALRARPFLALAALMFALAQGARAGERLQLNFNPGWKFIKEDLPDAFRPELSDANWTTVSLPHTFNDVDTFQHWSPPGHVGETNQWAGRTWYRKSFTVPESFRDKRVYLEFEAVRQVAEVYLNGQPLGTNKTGFIPFGYDLTPHLKFSGATNVLAVMADNRFTLETELTAMAATELPWNSPHWHPAHGGIYRNVRLHVTDPLHISLPLYSSLGTAGPYFYATGISERSAAMHGEIPVENGRLSAENVTARISVYNREGKSVLELQATKLVAAGKGDVLQVAGTIVTPKLWEPACPYLYRIVCRLEAGGQLVDTCEVSTGIRSIRWDAKSGFYINDHHLKLHGWGQRPTSEWPGLGAAQPDWMHYYTLALMKEAGGNFVRWGHCAGAPADITSADQLGLLVLQPGVDGEGDAQGEAWDIRASAFRDMLMYYRNHPSIVIWEGGNQKVAGDHARQLRGLMETCDPHGGRAYAHRRADEITAEVMDVDIGTEGGRQVPRLPVVEGEYDREESPRRVWDEFSPPHFGYPEAKGQAYQLTSEQYAVNQVSQYVAKLGRANHCGGANWIFSDSTSGGRVGCEVARASGEVDGVRLPKEAYYVCRTLFRNDPQIHIIGHWTYPAGTRKTVYVTSNCEEVELWVNGRSLGRGMRTNHFLFAFAEVAWEAGEIKAMGYRKGQAAVTQSKRAAGAPAAVRLTPILGPKGFLADGADVALVDVEVVDASGERCPTIQERVDFDLSGPGMWRGGYNSGKTNSVNNRFLEVECGINRVAIRSTSVPGQITLIARCGNLKPASVSLESRAVPLEHGWSPALPPLPPAPLLAGGGVNEELEPADFRPGLAPGRFLSSFSYSGPAGVVSVQEKAREGAKIYSDRDLVFSRLPELLRDSDWIQAANADKLYSAADLMDLSAKAGATIFVAHDNRLPRPDWLKRQFEPLESQVEVSGKPMRLFARKLRSGESLTLGSNTEDPRLKACNMYVVFVQSSVPAPGQASAAKVLQKAAQAASGIMFTLR